MNRVFRQTGAQSAFALFVGLFGIFITLYAANLALKWPFGRLVLIVLAVGIPTVLLMRRTATVIETDRVGLEYRGGLPVRHVRIPWTDVTEMRVVDEEVFYGVAPTEAISLAVAGARGQRVTVAHELRDIRELIRLVEDRTRDALVEAALRVIRSGAGSVKFGAVSVSHAVVEVRSIWGSGTIRLEELREWEAKTTEREAHNFPGQMLRQRLIRFMDVNGRELVLPISELRNGHVIVPVIDALRKRGSR